MDSDCNDLLEELECPVCVEYMLPPIAMCVNGHSTCSTCRENLLNCPVCRSPFSNVRSLLAESLVKKMRFPCRFSKSGCGKIFDQQRLRKHENKCGQRPFKCPFSSIPDTFCSWVGNVTNIKTHIRRMHNIPTVRLQNGKLCLELEDCNYPDKEIDWMRAIFCMGEIFFMNIRAADRKIRFCLRHVGLRNKTLNYKYKISITKANGPGSISAYSTSKYFQCDVDNIFRENECVVFGKKQYKGYIRKDGSLQYEVKMSRIIKI